MGCCGQNRSTWRAQGRAAARAAAPAPPRSVTVRLRWRRAVSAAVTGPATGARYAVSAAEPVVAVDPRDAVGLLATGFFARVG